MENKTTTELLEILRKVGNGAGEKYEQEKYQEAFAELCKRSPFWELLDDDYDEALPALIARVADLEEEVKKLKRHKHDANGDVMVRI